MFRTIVSIVISALLLGLAIVKCMDLNLANAGLTEWLWFGLFAIVGIIALTRIIALAKTLDNKIREK